MAAPVEAKPDCWIVSEDDKRMGLGAAFDYHNAESIFHEYDAQTGFENDSARLLDISDHSGLSDAEYDVMEPFAWGGASPFARRRFPTVEEGIPPHGRPAPEMLVC